MSDLPAAQRSKIRRLSQPKEPAPGEEAGELNVVPFLDIIMNVLMFVLASISIVFTVSLVANPPKPSPRINGGAEVSSLNLTVIVATDGFYLKGSGGSIAAGCNGLGAGPTVPRIATTAADSFDGRKYDLDGLRRCVRKLKAEVPGAEAEKQIILTANPNVPFQEIVNVLDAVRRDDQGELFPDAVFAVVR